MLLFLLSTSSAAEEFTPAFAKARLLVGGETRLPTRVLAPPPEGLLAGDLRLVVQGSDLIARRVEDGEPVWSWTAPGNCVPQVVEVAPGRVYLRLWKKSDDGRWVMATPGQLLRLNLSDGKLPLSLELPDRAQGETVWSLHATEREEIILSATETGADPAGETPDIYRVTLFVDGQPHWSRKFQFEESVGTSYRHPGRDVRPWRGAGVLPLSVVREDIIVCAGEGEEILALDRRSGEDRWRLPAVWEYERMFIGPSVWTYYLGRATKEGFHSSDGVRVKPTEEQVTEAAARLRRLRRIVAGPFAVPWRGGDGVSEGTHSISYRLFVAVARNRDEHAGSHLSSAFIYEMNHWGNPIAVLPMPSMVQSGLVRGRQVLWFCRGGAIGASVPSRQVSGMSNFGMARTTDHVGRLAWYRQPGEVECPDCWMSTGRSGSHQVIAGDLSFRVPAGGYLLTKDEGMFRFPIASLDLVTGAETDLLLELPFAGDIPPPKINYRHTPLPGGGETWDVYGHHMLSIAKLAATETHLLVTVRTTTGVSAELSFLR